MIECTIRAYCVFHEISTIIAFKPGALFILNKKQYIINNIYCLAINLHTYIFNFVYFVHTDHGVSVGMLLT